MAASFYWHDYETWGAKVSVDRPSQFAGVRTDEDLNILGEPLVEYCKPAPDILPQAEACLVTGISPQLALAKGLPEAEFIEKIHAEFSQPNTCVIGYNNIRFDDEITRYALYRNYFDPYEREWRNGNSRWDLIDIVRTLYALRPEGIQWPMVEGTPSFRLENLSAANGLTHGKAHDAFSDVEATIELARLMKRAQPQAWHYCFQHRGKRALAGLIKVKERQPLLHISSKFPASRGCAGIVVPLASHPTNNNAVIMCELSHDPGELDRLSSDEIRERLYTANADLAEGEQRIPLKLVHLNKCPVLLPVKMLDEKTSKRLGIDKRLCEQHWHQLLRYDLEYKMRQVFSETDFPENSDPEQQLYAGFFENEDRRLAQEFRHSSPEERKSRTFIFTDSRLNAMQESYFGRNYPELLSDSERSNWYAFVRDRLQNGDVNIQSIDELLKKIEGLMVGLTDQSLAVLHDLKQYALDLRERFEIHD
jgi:exodeoxyribonuclease-1